ncbi:MAG: hypothetical protein B6241_11905 [Spirochaetaceae bacterium 4572_59]|nr:MAG: hypothetical protein B6241_11905 [Spirochaetaceae bacterium 4572_59]
MKRIQVIILLFGFLGGIISASDLELSGYVRNYSGMYANDDYEFSILKNSFDLSMEYSSGKAALLANPYVNSDWSETGSLDFRELYIDLYYDTMDLRIGRQQIIWGKGDGVFITDVVSPKNLEEFILPDFKEIRIGVNAAKVDYYLGNSTFELIWVPQFTPNTMPDKNSIWNSLPIDFTSSDKDIESNLENSEIFGRYSLMTSIMDIELVAASMWDDEPVITTQSPRQLDYKRLFMTGGSLSSTLGDFVLRMEGAFYNGKAFTDETGSLMESDCAHYLGGLDYSVSGYNLSTQFIQRVLLEYKDSMVNDQFDNTMTFMINKTFFRETLTTEFFSYVEYNDLNALLRPKITYDFDDGVSILFGANIFLGDSGTYGQFDSNDMLYTQLKFNF